ncbi:MAG: hypothetical protein FJ278_21630, partial [Planctomycetes bacterium]|nr:hypothetical protein [Planctomycetota bacterium]
MKYTLGIMAILLAWPLAAQEIRPTEGYLAKFSRKVSAATRAQVALNVEFPQGVKLEACPVTFGVPFPRGALRAAENVRLLEGGKEVTC